jgi:hypothetical protein
LPDVRRGFGVKGETHRQAKCAQPGEIAACRGLGYALVAPSLKNPDRRTCQSGETGIVYRIRQTASDHGQCGETFRVAAGKMPRCGRTSAEASKHDASTISPGFGDDCIQKRQQLVFPFWPSGVFRDLQGEEIVGAMGGMRNMASKTCHELRICPLL